MPETSRNGGGTLELRTTSSSKAGNQGRARDWVTAGAWPRRAFLKQLGVATGLLSFDPLRAVAGPFEGTDFRYSLVPADKKLSAAWLRSLTERGEPTVYRGRELEKIGMPIGGICTGQIYLGGDGRLWHWDIFNAPDPSLIFLTSGPHYAAPMTAKWPVEQSFAIKINQGDGSEVRRLDKSGFRDITFCGQYPIATVTYRDPQLPIEVKLEAYSPFIPLNAEDSGLPATVMEFTVSNSATHDLEVELAGWMENAVCKFSPGAVGARRNCVVRADGILSVHLTAEGKAPGETGVASRPDILFADFEGGNYGEWQVEGTAFGTRPITLKEIPEYQSPHSMGVHGNALANSHASAPGTDSTTRDKAKGRLVSPEFRIERHFIRFLIGGGAAPEKLGLRLVVQGETVRSATGQNENKLRTETFDVRDFAGRTARLEIVDEAGGRWGNTGVDRIVFTDGGGPKIRAEDAPDFGSITLALLESGPDDRASADVDPRTMEGVFKGLSGGVQQHEKALPEKVVAALGRRFQLRAGAKQKAVFVIAWHFPRVEYTVPKLTEAWNKLQDFEKLKRYYAKRFQDASDVLDFVHSNFPRLSGDTKLWRDTWNDSTLPHWLLERTFLNVSTLATSACHRFDNGRYWFWEGVYCCQGTCTHVWHYAQAIGRIFPEIERDLRERVDYGISFDSATGMIGMRSEHHRGPATDGHAGTILRTLREHQMSADGEFLRRNWPRIKKAVEWLIDQDENADGIITRAQPNTLDREWFGEISWISSLYGAALQAGAELATEMRDLASAERWRKIAESGSARISERLFHKDQYFIQLPDPKQLDKLGSGYGCEIDQVFGQSWAWQVGLGRVLPQTQTRKALESLWRYNFAPDVGPFRKGTKISGGRWYAMPGEGGLIMCSFPDPEHPSPIGGGQFADYFNECMTGFEYQVASHMIWEGGDLVEKGLAVSRMIHDRYHAARRNPWNEVECGDHYGRAMASYGVFTAVCGFEHHGPKRHIGFAPRLTPENFRAPFIGATGWGTFWQKRNDTGMECGIELRWGHLRLKTLSLAAPEASKFSETQAQLGGKEVTAAVELSGPRVLVRFADELQLTPEKQLRLVVR